MASPEPTSQACPRCTSETTVVYPTTERFVCDSCNYVADLAEVRTRLGARPVEGRPRTR